jgi:MFS family permease
MLGLFMILPVFALHADRYHGATPALMGLAIGAYGLTQAALQIPFGMLSDRIGRKRVIIAGLAIFAAGSVVAALADTITGVILGRALQGAGAIAAAVLALTADLTREEQRTKAMAIIGASIGLTFALAMVLGPVVARLAGVSGVFWLTAALAIGGMGILAWLVPNPAASRFHRDTSPVLAQFGRILGDGQLLRLDLGITVLHFNMTAAFTVLPLLLGERLGIPAGEHGMIYLGVLAGALVLIAPLVMASHRLDRARQVFLGAIAGLTLAQLGLWATPDTLAGAVLLMVIYFTALMLLEAMLPALVSQRAPPQLKGTAMGAYSTCQFLGAFLGGVVGGWLHGRFGPHAVFAACAVLNVAWLLGATGMHAPHALSTQLLRVGAVDESRARALTEALLAVPGVSEAVIVAEDRIAYLKVDRKRLDVDALMAYAAAEE